MPPHDEKSLDEVRAQTDASIEEERVKTDEALNDAIRQRQDRAHIRLTAEAMLALERKITDKDLQEERKATDEEAQRAQEHISEEEQAHEATKQSLSGRDEFIAILNHDLRNPLLSISMGVELQLASIRANKVNAEEVMELALIVQRNAAFMDRLITDLLDVERMTTEKISLNKTDQSIEALFSECADIYGVIARKKSIELKTVVVGGPLKTRFDHDRLRQVMSNLLGNALKHTPSGGSITLEARAKNPGLEISITDSGIGIPLAEQTRIFNKFSQLKNNSRRGLGLGLYISKWIVEAHGGKIWVHSNTDEKPGSTFTFTIPK